MVNSQALNCTYSNGAGQPWQQVTPLTSSTPVGAVLWQRAVGLNINYQYGGPSGAPHELVSAAYWGPGTPLSNGVAPTNVNGIGIKVLVNSSDGVRRTILQTPSLVAMEKDTVQYLAGTGQARGSTLTTNYLQQLILTVPPNQLPTGEMIVERVDGSAQLTLYAIDLLLGVASLGGKVDVPSNNIPLGVCRSPYLLMGPAVINLGDGGGPIVIPSTCTVEAYKTVPVKLGAMLLSDFQSVGSMSAPRTFSIALSECAVNAKPVISFSDKQGRQADASVLTLQEGADAAHGFGIVVTNELTRQPIRFDGTGYPMRRVGEGATIPLAARYIRLGEQVDLKAGNANGAAEFTFTFP
ncbi:TPA: type 1 fimbrial protein [Pseudomonas putida]|nr:type 1 fimbrial protein [Pseudomonas putida]